MSLMITNGVNRESALLVCQIKNSQFKFLTENRNVWCHFGKIFNKPMPITKENVLKMNIRLSI